MTEVPFREDVPQLAAITDYDLAHLQTYLRLLDFEASNEGDWREFASVVFGIDPVAEPDRAHRLYEAHRQRAVWMTETGYRQLAAFEQLKTYD